MTAAHRLEGAAARAALRLLRALGPVRASNLGGWLARAVGPCLPVSRIAGRNLRMALPELDATARRRIIRGVWDNLGRTVAEFPHVAGLRQTGSGPGWEVQGAEHVEAMIQRGGPGVFMTAHIGNWEVLPPATVRPGLRFAAVYRPSGNPQVDGIIMGLRQDAAGRDARLFPKGAQGARQALAHLRAGGYLGMLADQKMNDGIEARFFGRPAMTASALAVLALRLRCTVLPTHVRRIGPARFRVIYDPPLPLPDTGSRAGDVAALTQAVNDHIEGWVRAWPEGWLWLHRRWPKAEYEGAAPG